MQFLHAIKFVYLFYHCHLISLIVGMTPGNIREMLLSHNFYRRIFVLSDSQHRISNMNQLVWNSYLAIQAASEVTCDSWNASIPYTNVGRIRSQTYMLTFIVRRWYDQISNFLNEDKNCFPWDGCPHLRNLINSKHTSVGCAVTMGCGQNADKSVIMCKYRGGDLDDFGFQFGTPCTACDGSTSFCRNNLCEACNPNIQECECKKTCRKEGTGYGYLNASTCTCNCVYGHGPNCDQPCVNREQYVDFDICTMLHPSDCNDPTMGDHYREFCPAVCSTCRPFPESNPEPRNVT